jgi:hypothetical protein
MIPPQPACQLTAHHLVLVTQHQQPGILGQIRADQHRQQAQTDISPGDRRPATAPRDGSQPPPRSRSTTPAHRTNPGFRAGHVAGVAPSPGQEEMDISGRAMTATGFGRGAGASGTAGKGESALGVPAHPGRVARPGVPSGGGDDPPDPDCRRVRSRGGRIFQTAGAASFRTRHTAKCGPMPPTSGSPTPSVPRTPSPSPDPVTREMTTACILKCQVRGTKPGGRSA